MCLSAKKITKKINKRLCSGYSFDNLFEYIRLHAEHNKPLILKFEDNVLQVIFSTPCYNYAYIAYKNNDGVWIRLTNTSVQLINGYTSKSNVRNTITLS